MIETLVYEFLKKNLSVDIFTDHQKQMPQRYVIFEKTGSSKRNFLLSSSIAFQSYAESKFEAAKLNEEVKEVVESLIKLDEVSKVKLNSDYDFTDTQTKKYRYQALFDINHY